MVDMSKDAKFDEFFRKIKKIEISALFDPKSEKKQNREKKVAAKRQKQCVRFQVKNGSKWVGNRKNRIFGKFNAFPFFLAIDH